MFVYLKCQKIFKNISLTKEYCRMKNEMKINVAYLIFTKHDRIGPSIKWFFDTKNWYGAALVRERDHKWERILSRSLFFLHNLCSVAWSRALRLAARQNCEQFVFIFVTERLHNHKPRGNNFIIHLALNVIYHPNSFQLENLEHYFFGKNREAIFFSTVSRRGRVSGVWGEKKWKIKVKKTWSEIRKIGLFIYLLFVFNINLTLCSFLGEDKKNLINFYSFSNNFLCARKK